MKNRFFFFIVLMLSLSFLSCSALHGLVGNENCAEGIEYNGIEYSAGIFYCADNDRTFMGYADNGAKVYTVGSKTDPIYMMIVGDDNTGCYIREGESVPTSGTVTKVLVDPGIRKKNECCLSRQEDLDAVAELTKITGEPRDFTVENFYTDGNTFYYVYDGCNVSAAKNLGGYIAYVDGTWIYSAPGSKVELKENNTVIVSAVVIDDTGLIDRLCKTNLIKHIK